MTAVYILIGFVAGALIAFLIMGIRQANLDKAKIIISSRNDHLQDEIDKLSSEISRLKSENEDVISKKDSLSEEIKNLSSDNTRLTTQIENKDLLINDLKDSFEKERARFEETRIQIETNNEKIRIENEKQWQLKFDKLKEEFSNVANKLLETKQTSLQEKNKEQLSELLNPIKLQFEAFRKSVEETKTANEVSKKELKDSFESTMKLFAQQQNLAVEALKQETLKIGNDANNLTNALKRDTKKQGNWGELILESLLESSGLEKNVHYFIQETVKDDDGKMLRPDVIVKFPEGRSVIIDSKVSLSAYTEAFETDDDEVKRRRMKDHARSVKKHVDELADKKYDYVVSDAIGFILMFIPNDQCYLSALEEDSDLSRYAYSKGIVIISPSNLMMALQLAFNMWQQHLRNNNIEKIVKTANDLYDKVATFSESMEKVEEKISQLTKEFNNAKSLMYEGRGNLFKKVESLKSLGITPKKQIKGLEA